MKKKVEKKSEVKHIGVLFLKAIDIINEKLKEAGKKPFSDNGLGNEIYPTSPSVINGARNGTKSIPHLALINFAKKFNVDMNYFYHDNVPFKFDLKNFLPDIGNETNKIKKEKLARIGLPKEEIDNLISFEYEHLAKTFKLDKIVRAFVDTLTGDFRQTFYNILHIIQFDYLQKIEKLTIEIDQTKNKLIEAKESENLILKKYVEKLL